MVAFSLALGASAAWGGADFLAGLKSRSLPVLSVIAVSQVTGLVVVTALAISLGVGLPEGETLDHLDELAGVVQEWSRGESNP